VSGNDAWQLTSASRPVLSARVNLLTKTEELNDGAWTSSSLTATDGATDPNGGSTAETLVATGANGTVTQSLTAVAANHTFSVWLRRKTGTGNVDITCHSAGTWVTQTVTSSWARYSVTQTLTAGSRTPGIRIVTNGDEVEAWGADLRVTNDGVGLPAYQRVNTSTDYDTTGFPMYLRFDGTDDSLATGDIDLSGSTQVTVWAGLRKSNDTSFQTYVANGTPTADANSVALFSTYSGSADYSYQISGSPTGASDIGAVETVNTFTAPITNIVTSQINIANAGVSGAFQVRVNGNSQTLNTLFNANKSSSGLANRPLVVGVRPDGNFRYTGRIYSLIVRGASSTAGQISDTEGWVNSRTRAY
jgi:hypothetical protein